jgi:hypothetical protein
VKKQHEEPLFQARPAPRESHSYCPPACTQTSARHLHDERDLRSGRSHFNQRAVQAVAHRERDLRRPGARHHDLLSGRRGNRRGGQRNALRRKGNRTRDELAGLPQRDMNRPLRAAQLGELAGAGQRVDDPHPVGRTYR